MIVKSTEAQTRKKAAQFTLEQLASPEYASGQSGVFFENRIFPLAFPPSVKYIIDVRSCEEEKNKVLNRRRP